MGGILGDDGADGVGVLILRGTSASILSLKPSWSDPGFRRRLRRHLVSGLSAFLYFSTSPSHSGSCVILCFVSIDDGDPSLSLPYTRKKD